MTPVRISRPLQASSNAPRQLKHHEPFMRHARDVISGFDLLPKKAVSLAQRWIAQDITPIAAPPRTSCTSALAWATYQLDQISAAMFA